jgi:sec-independent protein translocase protein TatA
MLISVLLGFLGGMGTGEVILLLAVVLLFFGAKRIPDLARGLGKGIKEFKDAKNGVDDKNGDEKA